MKKGILSTILVIQLILLVLITFSNLQAKRETFVIESQYQRLGAYKIASSFYDIKYDKTYLLEKNATNSTISDYIHFVNSTYEKNFLLDISINSTYLEIKDSKLEMEKGGSI
ncbi:MAG: hypothetical protein J7K73_02215 [Nanoarchaeota archaeon]|nr:hypothetical protein [Nanoarchaeota archaeon]